MSQASMSHPQIERYYSLRPQRYSVVVRIELIQDGGEPPEALALSLRILLRSQSLDEKSLLIITFWRVTGVELRQPPASEWQLFLDVRSVATMGWEKVNFRVVDNEQQSLTFLCESFEFEVADAQISLKEQLRSE